jgi:hypothetical protein
MSGILLKPSTDKSRDQEKNLQNLLPLDSYRRDESGYWTRMSIIAGVLFALPMAVSFYSILGRTPNLLHPRSPGEIVLIGVLSGLFFGALFPRYLRRKVQRFTDRLYSGDETLISIPSTEGPFDYKLPCTWLQESIGVGGVLYVGRSGLLFVPHKLNQRSAQFLRMAPLEALSVTVVESPRGNVLQRILVPHPQPLLQIEWLSESARFRVPSAATTTELLVQAMRSLRSASGSDVVR